MSLSQSTEALAVAGRGILPFKERVQQKWVFITLVERQETKVGREAGTNTWNQSGIKLRRTEGLPRRILRGFREAACDCPVTCKLTLSKTSECPPHEE